MHQMKKNEIKYLIIILFFSFLSVNILCAENGSLMAYKERQRDKAVALLGEMFNDPGGGRYVNGLNYLFILQDPSFNLWEEIRQDALAYFRDNNIPWWESTAKIPPGHLLSSQIACVNHLFFLRNRKEFVVKILQNIDSRIVSAEEITYPDADTGYVAFEIVGKENYLGEYQHTRGIYSTSVDAVMIGKKEDGKNILVLIEWKYTEDYEYGKSLYTPSRFRIYNPLLEATDSPFKTIIRNGKPFEPLYYEPYYELMRQTLLGWKMTSVNEYNCDEYIHLYIVPGENVELLLRNTSPGLAGNTISEIWQETLKTPTLFRIISPENFLEPLKNERGTQAFFAYLTHRYWN